MAAGLRRQMRAQQHGLAAAAVCAALVALLVGLISGATGSAPTSLTAWMHSLLSVSRRYPPPPGTTSDVGVVLGYALHKCAPSKGRGSKVHVACVGMGSPRWCSNALRCAATAYAVVQCSPTPFAFPARAHRNGSCTRPLESRVAAGVALYEQVTPLPAARNTGWRHRVIAKSHAASQTTTNNADSHIHIAKQGAVRALIFSGAHPGGGLRNGSEANAMAQYAAEVAGLPHALPGRCVEGTSSMCINYKEGVLSVGVCRRRL